MKKRKQKPDTRAETKSAAQRSKYERRGLPENVRVVHSDEPNPHDG